MIVDIDLGIEDLADVGMIRSLQTYLRGLSPAFVDGMIYVAIAFFTFNNTFLGNDEAAKFIKPMILFFTKWFMGCGGAVSLAVKLYRSTQFAQHQQEQQDEKNEKKKQDTAFWKNPAPPAPQNP